MYRQRREIYCKNVNEFNGWLNYANCYKSVIFGKKPDDDSFKNNAYIEDRITTISLSFRYGRKAYTYHFKKDCVSNNQETNGANAYRTLLQYEKIEEYIDKNINSKAILYKNPKFENKRTHAYSYDINSSYSFAMCQPLPIISTMRRMDYVGEDEIGFTAYEGYMELIEVGHFAHYVFKAKVYDGFVRFVNVWYKRKKEAKTLQEKNKAKQILNFCIGQLQNHNVFLRAAIIGYANNRIKSFIDKNTLYCNTDSIVSSIKRDDIESQLGNGLGEWKIEREGDFAFKGFNYQWDLDVPSYRGVPKSVFPENWDILCDPIPTYNNIYYLDLETVQLKEIEYEKE